MTLTFLSLSLSPLSLTSSLSLSPSLFSSLDGLGRTDVEYGRGRDLAGGYQYGGASGHISEQQHHRRSSGCDLGGGIPAILGGVLSLLLPVVSP